VNTVDRVTGYSNAVSRAKVCVVLNAMQRSFFGRGLEGKCYGLFAGNVMALAWRSEENHSEAVFYHQTM
jgi:hypothetical protein